MLFINKSGHTVCMPELGIPSTAPGECVEIEASLCKPGRADNGSRKKSPIECYAPQLVPADDAERAAWEKAPEPNPVTSRVVTSRGPVIIPPSAPPGVRAAIAARAAADAAPEPTAAPRAAEPTPAEPTAPPKARAKAAKAKSE